MQLSYLSFSQELSIDSFNIKNINWYNLDLQENKVLGTSVDLLYDSVLVNLKVKDTIVVAVIDGGVDIEHSDLAGKIWTNTDEIPGNQIDDDQNGYIDDIHGWNYIGNNDGKNIRYENYEYTRVIKTEQGTLNDIRVAEELYNKELRKRLQDSIDIERFKNVYSEAKAIILKQTGIDVKSKNDLAKVNVTNVHAENARNLLNNVYANGFSEEILEELETDNKEYLNYFLNKEFDPRKIVGDDPLDINDKDYGNSDVKGPRSDHGTSVAGVIAAVRNNNLGINGIAGPVKIMPLRVVPRGDERDKDIALAIRYAVDNGARIINMSFGKRVSPQKAWVDSAVRYAMKHDVLMVHAAGNYGVNIDETGTFPSDRFLDGNEAENWLNIGASNKYLKKDLPGKFSNYGKKHVDVFAPGIDIVSLDSNNTYSMNDGTSLAAPVVTGIAALILSYYPDITPPEMIDILLEGSFKISKPRKVYQPNLLSTKKKKIKSSDLSKSGGVINAYNSFLIATERQNRPSAIQSGGE